jgi:hypothetical protein
LGSCSSGTSSRVDVIQMGLYMSFILYLIWNKPSSTRHK